MKTIETTLTHRQHSHQIKNNKLKKTRKGVYPYEYMESFERFQEPQLQAKDAFINSSLTEEDIS